MTNPLEDVKLRADTLKTTIRAISGAPSVGFRDVLSTTISNIAGKMVAQMQPQQQPQASQPFPGQTNLTHPQQPTSQNPQGSRPRLVGTIFRSLMGQQQGLPQQQPIQGTGQDPRVQPGQREVAELPTDLQDEQTKHDAKIRRMQRMGVISGDDQG